MCFGSVTFEILVAVDLLLVGDLIGISFGCFLVDTETVVVLQALRNQLY